MADPDQLDWQALAERISARQRSRDSLIRGAAVVGDYARQQVWDGSLLQILLFRHRDDPHIDEGQVTEENGVLVVVDTITSGSLVELEELLHLEPLAGQLADMHTLRMADPTLRDVLAAFRDRYFSADGRQLRAAKSLQRARVALDDAERLDRPIEAVDAVRLGVLPAVSALIGEPLDLLRAPRRLRAAGRLLKLPQMWPELQDALGLEQVNVDERWKAADALHSLARSHLDARLPEIGAALMPRLERALVGARRGSASLLANGDHVGASWAATAAAAELDGVVEAASPGWRERDDYGVRAGVVYGRADRMDVAALRAVCVQVQRRVG